MGFEHFIEKLCKDTAVYWGSPVNDGDGFSYADPVEISCRWTDKKELYLGEFGEQQLSNAVVHVLQDVTEGGFLMLGTLADVSSALVNSPENVEGAFKIKKFEKIPNIAKTAYVRRVLL